MTLADIADQIECEWYESPRPKPYVKPDPPDASHPEGKMGFQSNDPRAAQTAGGHDRNPHRRSRYGTP